MTAGAIPATAHDYPGIILYFSANLIAFVLFGFDKFRATGHGSRIPEKYLLLAAGIGPFGALVGMAGFRHKTRHLNFLLVPVIAFLHLMALGFWLHLVP